jgi:fumarylpyruvate hydrolase
MGYVFTPAEVPSVAVADSTERFPVHRVYCVGRNYAAHAREMGSNPDREPPFFFTKPADALVANDATIPFPPRTANLHHEIELVVALGSGGKNISIAHAPSLIYGYAVGNDLTRRDLQNDAKDKGRPWDTGKAFDRSAPITAITPVTKSGHIAQGKIWLKVNGDTRQEGDIADLIWSVPEVIAELSTLFELKAGDLIFTGTPAGVSAVKSGDRIEGGVEGLATLVTTIV